MLKNKEYYEFSNNEIYEVDKNLNKEEKSLYLLIKDTVYSNNIMRKHKELEYILSRNFFEDFHVQYSIFNNIHIKDENNNLIFCKSFSIDYHINRKNKEIKVEFIIFGISANESPTINRVRINENGEIGKIRLNLSYTYNNENEIMDIIDNSFFDVLKQIVLEFKMDLYKHLVTDENFSLIRIQNFISTGKKIEDEKRIKKYLIENNFK